MADSEIDSCETRGKRFLCIRIRAGRDPNPVRFGTLPVLGSKPLTGV